MIGAKKHLDLERAVLKQANVLRLDILEVDEDEVGARFHWGDLSSEITNLRGLSRRSEQRLAYLAGKGAAAQAAVPGMRLVREWNGQLHTVVIDAEGAVRWNDQTWRSLSEVARAITGTRWSGPAFFGLRHKGRAA